ncbi:MAG: hypothetical protein ABSA11_16520 [Candidatus Bathyarchaeia archaeon]|jgi:hypothetical protein
MVDLAALQATAYVAQVVGVIGTLTAAFIAVRSYVNANRRAEEAKRKEQETRDRELETRGAQLFMEIYRDSYSFELMNAQNTVFKMNLKDIDDYDELMNDLEKNDAFLTVAMWLEGMGVLVREGLINIRLVSELSSGYIQWWWTTFGDYVRNVREARGFPRFGIARWLVPKFIHTRITLS